VDKMPPMNARRIASFVAMQAVPETYNRCTTIGISAQIVRVFTVYLICCLRDLSEYSAKTGFGRSNL